MKTIGDLLRRNAVTFADRSAFVFGDQRLSHGDLYARSSQLASAIERTGTPRQSRIAILSANNIEYFEIYGACEIGAFIATPVSFRAAGPEVQHILTDSGACVLFFEYGLADLVDRARAALSEITRYVCIGGPAPEWAADYEAFLASGDRTGPRRRSLESDYVYLFYTSGTTGKPKGVPMRHAGQIISARGLSDRSYLSLLQISPAFHIAGRSHSLSACWVGGKTVLHNTFEPTTFLETVAEERIRACFMVPAMLLALLDHPSIDDYDLSTLDAVMLASTTIPTELLRRGLERFGAVFYLAYGSTEGGFITRLPQNEVHLAGDEAQLARLASVGRFEDDIDGEILDDDGNPCAVGEVGEVCIHNSHVFEGYWNNHNATLDSLHGDAFRTGDLGYLDEQGYVYLVDRKKDMLISGGENIYSREVEEALDKHPAVRQSAVIGKADPTWGETVCAIVTVHPGVDLDTDDLIAFARTQIASFKCPKTVIVIDEMPLQSTGKVDKLLLRKRYGGT